MYTKCENKFKLYCKIDFNSKMYKVAFIKVAGLFGGYFVTDIREINVSSLILFIKNS